MSKINLHLTIDVLIFLHKILLMTLNVISQTVTDHYFYLLKI